MDYTSIAGMDLFGMPFRNTQATGQAPVQQAVLPQQKTAAQRTTPAQRPVAATAQRTQTAQNQTASVQQLSALAKTAPEPKAAEPVKTVSEQKPAVTATQPESPAITKKATIPVQEKKQSETTADTQKSPVPATQPKKELLLDMSSDMTSTESDSSADDQERRKAHEAAEAKRKAEWEAKQRAKKQAEEAAVKKLQEMSDDDILSESTKRIRMDVERLTRRNMKECVSEHIQALCRKDPAFARKTMYPRKSMINCFKYINRQARDYVEQEMKDNDIKPDNGGYGCDVPDGIVYQFSENYFNDPDAPEDQEKEETFIPKPYVGAVPKTKKAASKAKKDKEKQETSGEYQQMSFV